MKTSVLTFPPHFLQKKQQQLLRHRCTISGNAGGSGRISGIVLCIFFPESLRKQWFFSGRKQLSGKIRKVSGNKKNIRKKNFPESLRKKYCSPEKNHFPESLCIFNYSFIIFFIFFLRKENFLEFDSLNFIYSDYMRFHPYRGRQYILFHKDLIGDVNTLGFIKTTYFLIGDLSAGMGPETLVSDPF